MVDAAMAWGDDPAAALARMPCLETFEVRFLEEPFVPGANSAYRSLAARSSTVKLAGGEGCHDFYQAHGMMENAAVDIIQIDAGRVGGITTARRIVDLAEGRGLGYVNHTFTSHLALSASLQPFAGIENADLCEYPVSPRAVSWT